MFWASKKRNQREFHNSQHSFVYELLTHYEIISHQELGVEPLQISSWPFFLSFFADVYSPSNWWHNTWDARCCFDNLENIPMIICFAKCWWLVLYFPHRGPCCSSCPWVYESRWVESCPIFRYVDLDYLDNQQSRLCVLPIELPPPQFDKRP